MAACNECIICFNETYDSGERITVNMEVNEFVSIVKKCDCKFKVHETCFLQWIHKKPVCPYCRKGVSLKPKFPKLTVIKDHMRCNPQRVKASLFIGFMGMMAYVILISGSQ
tara:strand:+ start:1390 stop:1722 length:333 start_codon:yes stop_codon:yes gene_type:complete